MLEIDNHKPQSLRMFKVRPKLQAFSRLLYSQPFKLTYVEWCKQILMLKSSIQ